MQEVIKYMLGGGVVYHWLKRNYVSKIPTPIGFTVHPKKLKGYVEVTHVASFAKLKTWQAPQESSELTELQQLAQGSSSQLESSQSAYCWWQKSDLFQIQIQIKVAIQIRSKYSKVFSIKLEFTCFRSFGST